MGDPVEEQLDAALIALRHAYEDCLRELVGLREGVGGFTRRRGVLAAAGTTIEHLLKILHRLEHRLEPGDPPGKPPRKMTLDELVTGVRGALPEHVQVPIRTIQGYRNLGAHDSGDLRAVDARVLGAVQTALGLVLAWFFRSYLGGRYGEPAVDEPAVAETGPEPLTAWRELFWWAMRGGALKLIDRKGLERRQREAGIPEASVQAIEAGYRRDTALFDAALAEAAGGYVLEDHEAEGLEEVRLEACISEREATTRAARPLGRLVALPPRCPAWMAEAWRSGAELTLDGLPPEPDLAVAAPPPPPSPLDVPAPAPVTLRGLPPVANATEATPLPMARVADRPSGVKPKAPPFDAEAFWRGLPKETQNLPRPLLALLGRSVREGLRLRPDWVSAYARRRDKIRVLMGRLVVMALEGRCVWVALDEATLAVPGSWLRSWTWDDELTESSPQSGKWSPYPRYVRPPSRNGGYDPSLDPDGREWTLIEAAHFAYLRAIVEKGYGPASNTRDDPGWVDCLASLASVASSGPRDAASSPPDPSAVCPSGAGCAIG